MRKVKNITFFIPRHTIFLDKPGRSLKNIRPQKAVLFKKKSLF